MIQTLATPELSQDEQHEYQDWLDSLEDVMYGRGAEQASRLLEWLQIHAQKAGVYLPVTSKTPYLNSIPREMQPPLPGDRNIERRIKSFVRWNAMAMVVRANRSPASPGGHISTFASSATLYEVGQSHFFKGPNHPDGGDLVYFQGHAAPGMYSRAFLEGRISEKHLMNFRRELRDGMGHGLSSYPHPWLMPEFWQFPTVSMGLGPICAIYQARYMRYLEDRGLKPRENRKVWAFLGDGECDEPETLGAISLAVRERLDNLIFVINCNLQRLDGPVRGNGNIIQELEAVFRGAGWNVLKVIWGSDYDPLFARDEEGLLARRMGEILDGQWQKFSIEDGAYIRKHLYGTDQRLLDLVRHIPDDKLYRMGLGGHDPAKVYAAYKRAVETHDRPTCVIARTVKGYGLGEAGEGKNIAHNTKKMNEEELLLFRDRFEIPLTDEQIKEGVPFYRPPEDSPEIQYMLDARRKLGGPVPQRNTKFYPVPKLKTDAWQKFYQGTEGKAASTTMVFINMLGELIRDKDIGKLIVPIVPDEGRTFGMEGLYASVGIYSSVGQLYEPVDKSQLMYYREAKQGQIIQEGITEAGSMCSFIASGTAYSNYGVNTIPFYIYYSMFGPQRVGDLIWCGADSRMKGFLIGGTAGRTTLNGEGLQHQDGQSLLYLSTVPNAKVYDPTFAYEMATIILDGIQRMYHDGEHVFYYLTCENENYPHPPAPDHLPLDQLKDGILKGLYLCKPAQLESQKKAYLLGSGAILNEVLAAQQLLADDFGVAADVWSATSYVELRREALACERHNLLHPEETERVPYLTQCFDGVEDGVFVASSDYVKDLPDGISRWLPGSLHALGTDGFGRSESREQLRYHFEVDRHFVVLATLQGLARKGRVERSVLTEALRKYELDPEKLNPALA